MQSKDISWLYVHEKIREAARSDGQKKRAALAEVERVLEENHWVLSQFLPEKEENAKPAYDKEEARREYFRLR